MPDQPADPPSIVVQPDGPYLVRGVPIRRRGAGGREAEVGAGEVVVLCRCGASRRKPWCDGSHVRVGFRDACAAGPPAAPPGTGA